MRANLRQAMSLLVGMGLMIPVGKAQFFEDTWQEFLKNSKASAISELVMPSPKEQPGDYAKYCLMYATDHFCAGDVKPAEAKMADIRTVPETTRSGIAGFKERYEDLGNKIQAYHKLDEHWKNFILNRQLNVSGPEIETAKKVCEKTTLAKVWYLESQNCYCKADVAKSKEHFETRVMKLADATSFDLEHVDGMPADAKIMKEVFAGITKLDPAWKQFISSGTSPGFDTDIPLIKCYPVPQIKVYILRAAVDVCKVGSEMLKKIKELQAINTHPLDADVTAKIKWLEEMVGTSDADVAKLNTTWKEFMAKGKANTDDLPFEYPCDRAAQVKAYIIDGMSNICEDGRGEKRLADIAATRKEYNPTLDQETLTKLKELEDKVKKYKEDSANLEKAWQTFIVNDTLTTPMKFGYDYPCDRAAQIKAYVITGLSDVCGKGREMMDNITKTREQYSPELAEEVTSRIDKLKAKVAEREADLAELNRAWKAFTPQDTLVGEYRLLDFYCDKIAQIKSWTIRGHLNSCAEGQQYLNKINELQKKHSLTYDEELACRVTRLRIKVWDCRWWELVRQARKETHEERERFGPASAAIMAKDIHNDQCPPDVLYQPLGFIGIKYVIVNYLCQKEDGGKIGSADYYKKIAAWVDNQVLTKYCQPNMRCKEDFFIYLEGHTDGNAFSGRTYQESLAIPLGTEFTHYMGKDTLHKKTDRAITTSLKNNMELGLARAWLMKRELMTMNAFMGVPITIGAYEHPATEKGGTYRRIEIELNMTNLLLDYYEKRLKELHVASGIGERPKECAK